jgi:hypothetical protein
MHCGRLSTDLHQIRQFQKVLITILSTSKPKAYDCLPARHCGGGA